MSRTLRQHFIIARSLATSREFSQNINLNFDPHEVIVREVVYIPANGETGVYSVRSTLTDNSTSSYLCSFEASRNDATGVFSSGISTPQSVFTLSNFVNSIVYQFQVINVVSGAIANLGGQLSIHWNL